MTHHGDDFGVDQLLRNGSSGFRIAGIVFSDQFQHDFLAVDREACLVDFFDRQARAVFVVLAKVRDRASERTDVTNLDRRILREGRTTGRHQGDCRYQRQKFCSKFVLHV